MARRSAIIAGLVLLSLPAACPAFTVPTGPNFRANVDTAGAQTEPVVASDGAGHYVAAWRTAVTITGQRFDATGARVGAPFTVTTGAYYAAQGIGVAVAPGGITLVAWPYPDGSGGGIRAALFDAMGAPQGPDFAVNSSTTGNQDHPTAAADGAGNFVVAWNLGARRFDTTGAPLEAAFSFGAAGYTIPDVAADSAGNFVIVWRDNNLHVLAQRYDATATPQGAAFEVPATPGAAVTKQPPSVAMAADGDFVVAWEQDYPSSIRARRFDASGTPQGGDIVADTQYYPSLYPPAVAIDAAEDFLLTWQRSYYSEIAAARFESDGTPQGGALVVSGYTLLSRFTPAVAADGTGGFLLVWNDTIGEDIVAQRFSAGCGDGTVQTGEQCDDGNLNDGDGCQATCTTQSCFACAGAPSSCAPITTCASGDGCCLPGCTAPTDLDCPRQITGGSLVIKDFEEINLKDQLTFRSKDSSFDTTPGTGVDPIADGAYLHVHSGSGGTFSGCFELANSAWSMRGSTPTSPVFVYSDRDRVNGSCTAATVRDGRVLRLRCSRDIGAPYGFGSSSGPLGSVAVRFGSGAREYCALFGGDVRKDGPRQFVASTAPAPAYCPAPALPCPRRLPSVRSRFD